MKFSRLLLCIFTVIAIPSAIYSDSSYTQAVAEVAKKEKRDRKARSYVYQNTDTYIAVIWPRGISHLDGIRDILSQFAPIIYEKDFTLDKYGPVLLYQVCQLGISPASAEKKIKNDYLLPGMIGPYQFHAFLFQTKKQLREIVEVKQKIRDYVGCSYWSIHIDDNHSETQKLADALFVNPVINFMNNALWGISINALWNIVPPVH